MVPAQAAHIAVRRSNYGGATVETILDWLWATRTMSDMQRGEAAKSDWVRVFTPCEEERARLVAQASHVHHDTLRQSRVRLDALVMLLHRLVFKSFNWESTFLYLFCDGSPQWRGHELFASTVDVFATAQEFQKRILLPLISLARCCLGVQGHDLKETSVE